MWNSSFCREGCGLTGDIWIISDESESGTLNTFRCFRKLPQFATDSESERMYIFLSPEDYFRNQEKMWDKVVKSLSFRPFPFMQVITMAFFGSRTWSYCFTCADDHHGVLEFVELVLCPSPSRWQVYSLFNDYPCLEIYYRWTMAACNVAAGWTRCMVPEARVVVFQGAFQYNSCS